MGSWRPKRRDLYLLRTTLSKLHNWGTQRFGGANWLEGGTAEEKGTMVTLPAELA